MYDNHLLATVLAAHELLPAEPSDLTGILLDDAQRGALSRLEADARSTELTSWLCEQVTETRVMSWRERLQELEREATVHVVMAHEDSYPSRLAACWDRPPFLFIKGQMRCTRSAVAIVGSRVASDATLLVAEELGSYLAGNGVSVISGMAAGVDTAAHQGALRAGGDTVAVMGTGINRVFPESNAGLALEIAASGALVSQFSPDAPRTGTTFLKRNNVIAGLADISVVLDGKERSGSRHQSEQAARYNRQVLLWAPTLFEQPWAQAAVACGNAAFVSHAREILAFVGADS